MSQNQEILSHLKTGAALTQLEALNKFGSFRLASRIYDLKQEGWPIHCDRIKVNSGKTVGHYYLHGDRNLWPDQ